MNGTNGFFKLCLAAAVLLPHTGCAYGKRKNIRLTSEPSIERALDVLEASPASAPLSDFLHKRPVAFEYSNTPGPCHKFSLKSGQIFLPPEYKNSDKLLALGLAGAAYIYRLYTITGLEEILAEEEELAALFQARIGLITGIRDADFGKAKGAAAELKKSFCSYIMEGSKAAARAAHLSALSIRPDCQRPLETMRTLRLWLDETRAAIDNESFFELLNKRDLAKVRRGSMTMSEAMKNDAEMRTLPSYTIYRYQRSFFEKQNETFAALDGIYRKSIADDEAWRAANQDLIERAREEFSSCSLPDFEVKSKE